MNDIEFTDGLVYIQYDDNGTDKATCRHVCEYDDPIRLSDIAKEYPTVKKVLYNEPMKGWVYTLKGGQWENTGTTKGYI